MEISPQAPLELVAPRPEYAVLWHRWRRQRATVRFNPLIPRTLKELRETLATLGTDLSRLDHHAYMWFVQEGDHLVGSVNLKEINRMMKLGEIGYGISESYQGRGYGTRAVRLLVDKVFGETDLYKLVAYVSERNLASRRLIEKVGFRPEGLLREHYLVRGRRMNEVLYGLLRPEWEKRRPGRRKKETKGRR